MNQIQIMNSILDKELANLQSSLRDSINKHSSANLTTVFNEYSQSNVNDYHKSRENSTSDTNMPLNQVDLNKLKARIDSLENLLIDSERKNSQKYISNKLGKSSSALLLIDNYVLDSNPKTQTESKSLANSRQIENITPTLNYHDFSFIPNDKEPKNAKGNNKNSISKSNKILKSLDNDVGNHNLSNSLYTKRKVDDKLSTSRKLRISDLETKENKSKNIKTNKSTKSQSKSLSRGFSKNLNDKVMHSTNLIDHKKKFEKIYQRYLIMKAKCDKEHEALLKQTSDNQKLVDKLEKLKEDADQLESFIQKSIVKEMNLDILIDSLQKSGRIREHQKMLMKDLTSELDELKKK